MIEDTIAITGMGCICSAGRDVPTCLSNLYASNFSLPTPPSIFVPGFEQDFPVFSCRHYLAPEFDNQSDFFVSSCFGLQVTYEALEMAGLAKEELAGLRVGVCFGTTVGASLNILEFYQAWKAEKNPAIGPVQRYLRSNPAFFIQNKLGLKGPCQTVANACSSGTDALGIAKMWLEQDICDIVLAGGADELNELAYSGFIRLMNCSAEPCRPFDLQRKGLNLGEGAAVLVLEKASRADARKAEIKGHLLGYGTASDAHHLTAPHPEAAGLTLAFFQALTQAGTRPEDIGVVNIHGTATRANDQAEGCFLRELLPDTPFFGTKGMTGHTLGAAGAMEAIFALSCLQKKNIPATAGYQTFDPELGMAPARKGSAPKNTLACSLSLAFGGNNSVLIFQG